MEEPKPNNKTDCNHKGNFSSVGQIPIQTDVGLTVFVTALCTECGDVMIKPLNLKGVGAKRRSPVHMPNIRPN